MILYFYPILGNNLNAKVSSNEKSFLSGFIAALNEISRIYRQEILKYQNCVINKIYYKPVFIAVPTSTCQVFMQSIIYFFAFKIKTFQYFQTNDIN
jgi:hypothetical protein